MRNGFAVTALVLVTALAPTSANAVLIDFEAFAVNDGLAQVNAVTTPLGATFDASPQGQVNGGPFTVIDLGGNKVIRTGTWPADADVLINFSMPVAFVQVTFVDNPDNTLAFVTLTARDKTGTADGILGDPSATVVGNDTGNEPDVLSISAAGIRSLQIESGSGRLYFDNVQFRFAPTGIPEPGTLAALTVGLLGLGALRRRRRAA